MSLASCEHCWMEICECGEQYKYLPLDVLEKLVAKLQEQIAERKRSADRAGTKYAKDIYNPPRQATKDRRSDIPRRGQ